MKCFVIPVFIGTMGIVTKGLKNTKRHFFLFATTSRPVLEHTQLPIQWILGALSPEWGGWGLKLTTHFHLLPRLMHGAILPLPLTSSWWDA